MHVESDPLPSCKNETGFEKKLVGKIKVEVKMDG